MSDSSFTGPSLSRYGTLIALTARYPEAVPLRLSFIRSCLALSLSQRPKEALYRT